MLTLSQFAEAKGFDPAAIATYGLRQGLRGVEIPYFDMDGSERPRVRLRTALAAKDGSTWSEGDAPLVPYGLHRPVAWDRAFVFIVEGETDCLTFWMTGKPALGLPGASNVKCLKLEHVDGAESVCVIREPGTAGARFPHRVAERLYGLGFSGHVYALDLDAKDPHELWRQSPETFDERLRAAFVARELIEPLAKKAEVTEPAGVSSLAALIAKPRVKTREIVEGLLPAGGILLLAAKPKAGKSVLARNLALAVARGVTFLDRQCERGRVIYVRLDEGYNGFLDAIEAMGVDEEAAQRFHLNDEMPPVEGRMAWLTSWVQKIRPVLVIIDTWAKLTNVREIKSYSEVIRANEPLDRLAREHGIAQVWVHHAKTGDSTGGDAVLGGTSLFSGCDTLMNLQAYPDGLRSVSTIQRQGEDMEETPIVMDRKTQLVSIAPAKMRLRRGKVEERIIELLTEQPEQSKDELAEACDFRRSDVLAALAALVERGIVEGVGDGVRGAPVLYFIRVRNGIDPVREPNPTTLGTESGSPGNGIRQLRERNTVTSGTESDLFGNGIDPVREPNPTTLGTESGESPPIAQPLVFGAHAGEGFSGGSKVRALRALALALALMPVCAHVSAHGPRRAHTYAPASNIYTNSYIANSLVTNRLNTNNLRLEHVPILVSPNPVGCLLLADGDLTAAGGGLEHGPRVRNTQGGVA